MPDIVLECRGVHHWFGANQVLYDVNLRLARGEIVALVGPSGCGKTTLLQAILGTHPPRRGEVLMDGQPCGGPSRARGIVYQRYSLFPFLTAEKNVAIGPMFDQTSLGSRFFHPLQWRALRKTHLRDSVAMLQQLGLANAIGRYPEQLSGGMRQRVAIAQALIMKPGLLLLDEPFGALDEATREDLQAMLLRLYQENLQAKRRGEPPPHTILMVTHELNEAIYVADRVIGLSQYWQWKEEGFDACPGATIIYDRTAPVFHPEDPREFGSFLEQRSEIRRLVFEHRELPRRGQHTDFWETVAAGQAPGIMAPNPPAQI